MSVRAATPAALTLSLCIAIAALPAAADRSTQDPQGRVSWRLDNLASIGGHAVQVIGAPRVVPTDVGPAIEFDGEHDGLLIDANPLEGLGAFTLEVVFQPADAGAEEQRFVHIEERTGGNRVLVELRRVPGSRWSLDTYLRSGDAGLTLLDRSIAHPAASRWHVATLTYDGRTMTHYVDGVRELSGETAFAPLGPGRTSVGVRQNQVSWFKGRIHSVRFARGATDLVIPLWPEGVPGKKPGAGDERFEDGRLYNVQEPSLVYVPPVGTPDGTAAIVCPGGSFARLAMANEAAGIAARLQLAGVAVFILKYRLAEYGQPAPLQDVLRAVRTLRSRAAALGLRPDRIGVIGASAGGHVAAAAATMFDAPDGGTGAAIDRVSARPDFAALLYPVITMDGPQAHADSRRNLLGSAPSASLRERWSLERRVRADMPPVFLVHTAEDTSVPLEHSLLFFQAMRRVGASAELHLFERGAHGFGTRSGLGSTSAWIDRLLDWLDAHGFAERG